MKRLISAAAYLMVLLLGSSCGGPQEQMVVAEFVDVGDLVTRANVQQSDAVVGSTGSIDLVERGGRWIARVEMKVDPDAKVTRGTRAVVQSTSLLGEKYVDLIPPRTPAAELESGEVIPVADTAKAPELEAVFSQLGGILESGGLEDLAKITTASAVILEGQEETVGRTLDQTAKLISSLASQKDALASGLFDLAEAAEVLSDRRGTLDRALDVSDDALRVVASQQSELDELVVQLDRLGAPLAELMGKHKGDIDAQLKALNTVVPRLHQVRGTLERAVDKLPKFTKLFARSIPGDYAQLDVFAEGFPVEAPASASGTERGVLADLLMEATR